MEKFICLVCTDSEDLITHRFGLGRSTEQATLQWPSPWSLAPCIHQALHKNRKAVTHLHSSSFLCLLPHLKDLCCLLSDPALTTFFPLGSTDL